ncbi:hypothetical protein WJX84_002115 [Apatococcus fuscideae]|uniref:Protein YIP n=1 Tax=Apatococcus fuscideae TaxID=2026836 RepID=A0AAW1SR14_9CHLO
MDSSSGPDHSEFSPDPHQTVAPVPSGSSGPSTLAFNESQLPTHHVSGKVGDGVPRAQPYATSLPTASGPPLPVHGGGDPVTNLEQNAKYALWNLRRYRRYFNVDTEDVLVRMKDSLVGSFKPDFLDKITDNEDLYGPFWVVMTLIFVTAVVGNYSSYENYKRKHTSITGQAAGTWYYDVNKVLYSAILFFGYVWILGAILFVALKFVFKSEISLPQVWCTYGYAMTVFIPASFFCFFPNVISRWVLCAVATATSGIFLLLNFRAPIFDSAGAKAVPIWLAMGACHLGLGLILRLYFFKYQAVKIEI